VGRNSSAKDSVKQEVGVDHRLATKTA
jgi:hypothetical protein